MQTKKILSTLAAAFLFSSTFGFVSVADPGPNGENDKGLCTAYFNGQKKGHDKQHDDGNGQYPGPFNGLEEAGNAYTDSDGVDNDRDGETDEEGEHNDLSAAENIFNFCNNTTDIMGNPEHGRFTCTDDGSGDSDPDCTENEDPGNGGGNGKGNNG